MAKTAAARSLELYPQLAAGHTAVGYTRLHFDWDTDAACQQFDETIMLNPEWVDAHHCTRTRDALRVARDLQRMRGDKGAHGPIPALRSFRHRSEKFPQSPLSGDGEPLKP